MPVWVAAYTETDRNGTKRTGKGTNGRYMEAARRTEMVDMEVKMRGEKKP